MPHEFNVLALVKGEERYIFVYDDDSRSQVVEAFRDAAADPHQTLTWFDAVVLTKKAKEQQAAVEERAQEPQRSRIPD